MYIVIAGGGSLGQGLAKRLVESRHDVVVIDSDSGICEYVSARIGALAMHGAATSIDLLEEAGLKRADVAVGALPSDADNLAFGLLAKNFGVPRVMARMRNPQYESAYQLAGITRPLNVRALFVQQLVLEIEQPSIRQVANFGRGTAAIVVVVVPEDAAAHGRTVKEIAENRNFPTDCVIAGIFRESVDDFVFPRGNEEIRQGDQVFLAAHTEDLKRAAEFLRRPG